MKKYINIHCIFNESGKVSMAKKMDKCLTCSDNCFNKKLLTNNQLALSDDNHRTIQFKKGETILKQGSFVTHIIFLINGLVKLTLEGTNGRTIIHCFQTSGNFLGLSALYTNDSFPYTIEAVNDSTVCMIRKEAFVTLQKGNLEIEKIVFDWYILEHKEMYSKIITLGTKNMPGRLADTILYLTQERFQKEDIFNYITRRDIADFAAMSLESMMKYFTEFKNDKLILVKGKKIIINNLPMIERLSRVS